MDLSYFKRASLPKRWWHICEEPFGTEGNGKVSLCLRSITNHTCTNCQGLTSLKKSSVHSSFFCLWPSPSTQFMSPRAATCLFPSLLQFSLVSLTHQPADENCRRRGHVISGPAAALGVVKLNYGYIPACNTYHFPSLKQDGLACFFLPGLICFFKTVRSSDKYSLFYKNNKSNRKTQKL